MNNKLIIIISIISIIISVIYVILSYFGILRYVKMYIYSPENFIDTYKKLDTGDVNNRVVISITTTPDKLKHIKPVINSLLDQTVKVDLISITTPSNQVDNIPDCIKKAVSVYKTGIDYGDANSLIPVILREGELNTKIITVGDNTIYGKDFIEHLIEKSIKQPDSVIYTNNTNSINLKSGAIFPVKIFNEDFVSTPVPVNDYVKEKININYRENYRKL